MSSSSVATPPSVRSGTWDGSEVHEDHIEFLHRTRRLPGEDRVQVRLAPEGEISPAPQEGEQVIFRSHCLRGLGLPASSFFRSYMEFYGVGARSRAKRGARDALRGLANSLGSPG